MKRMSSLWWMVTVSVVCSAWAWMPRATAQGLQRGPQIVSPEVQSDGHVVFRIQAPKASEITLWGDWMGSSPAEKLAKGDQDIWSATVGPLVPDLYCYSFTVDGVKIADPRNPLVKQGVTGVDSMFFMAGEESAFEDNKPVPHGQIRQVWYFSKTLDAQRRMQIGRGSCRERVYHPV